VDPGHLQNRLPQNWRPAKRPRRDGEREDLDEKRVHVQTASSKLKGGVKVKHPGQLSLEDLEELG